MTSWPALLRLAATLGVTPDAFWRLSLAEWRALTAPAATGVLDRAGLDALSRAWPD